MQIITVAHKKIRKEEKPPEEIVRDFMKRLHEKTLILYENGDGTTQYSFS